MKGRLIFSLLLIASLVSCRGYKTITFQKAQNKSEGRPDVTKLLWTSSNSARLTGGGKNKETTFFLHSGNSVVQLEDVNIEGGRRVRKQKPERGFYRTAGELVGNITVLDTVKFSVYKDMFLKRKGRIDWEDKPKHIYQTHISVENIDLKKDTILLKDENIKDFQVYYQNNTGRIVSWILGLAVPPVTFLLLWFNEIKKNIP